MSSEIQWKWMVCGIDECYDLMTNYRMEGKYRGTEKGVLRL